jgi:fatty acid elongase 3
MVLPPASALATLEAMARDLYLRHAVDFKWSDAPLSGPVAPLCAVAGYLLVVWALVRHMASRGGAPYAVPTWVAAGHNVVLSVGSGIMFVGCGYEAFSRWGQAGDMGWVLCEAEGAKAEGALFFWSYMYYLSKYYELLDTVIGLLRGSRMPNFGLQVYHHAVVIIMAWLWCETAQSLQVPGLMFNTFVHVIMYAYFWARTVGIFVPKPIRLGITQLQIVQFVTSGLLLAAR